MEIQVPVIKEVDVLIIGGTLAGCTIALKMRRAARRVLLVCEDDALGTDAGGRLDRARANAEPLLQNASLTPGQTNAHLDETLLNAGAEFLLDVIPLRPLVAAGTHKLAGWFFFGRSGHFAIAAKAVIDATFNGILPYQMRLSRRSSALAECTLQWNLVGNCADAKDGDSAKIEINLPLIDVNGGSAPLCTCRKSFRLRENDMPEKLDAETLLRSEASGNGFCHGAKWCTFSFTGPSPWEGIKPSESMPLFRADSPDNPALLQYTLPAVPIATSFLPVDCRHSALRDGEELFWHCRYPRPGNFTKTPLPLEALPTAPEQETDVLIIGAGIAGTQAAVTAAADGLRVLLIEGGSHIQMPLRELVEKGVRVWHHCSIEAVLMSGKAVVGALVGSASGEACIVRAKAIIDATGYGIVAAAAGAPTKAPHTAELIVPGTIVAPRMPSNAFGNPDGLLFAENDTMDSTRALVMDHIRQKHDFCGNFAGEERIRPRIVSDVTIMPQDVILERCYKDTIALAKGTFPAEAQSCHPLLWLSRLCGKEARAWIPFRALLPIRIDGVLVLGSAISVHKDVLPICQSNELLRMEGCVAGHASAMAISQKLPLRQIPIRKLQELLVKDGLLPEQVLEQEDCLAAPDASHLAAIFHRPDQNRRILQAQFDQDRQLDIALILAFLGDSSGRDVITNAIKNCDIENSPRDFCILVEALSIIGGNSTALQNKLRTLPQNLSLPLLRCLARFFQRWPDKSAATFLRRLLQSLMAAVPPHTALSEALDTEDCTEELRLKMLYLAVALHECSPEDEDAMEALNAFSQSWHLLIAILVHNTLKH